MMVKLAILIIVAMIGIGKVSVQPHTIVKQICFPNGNVLFLSLFPLFKNWMHNVGWGCAGILPRNIPHKWIMLFAHTEWLFQKWMGSTVHFCTADETK